MSTTLYRLGRFVTRRPGRVLGVWVLLLTVVAALAAAVQTGTDDSVHIPGAESTVSLDHLRQVFPELAGSGVLIVVEQPPGQPVDTPTTRAAVGATVSELKGLAHVVYTADPFDPQTKGEISPDRRLAVIAAFLDVDALNVTPQIKESLADVGGRLQRRIGGTARVHLGGDALSTSVPRLTPTESLGLLSALLILLVTLGSVVAAGLPMLTALFGAATTLGGIYLATAVTPVMSSAPVLALMLGLAVGIDYALFVLVRHREQLRDRSLEVPESVARATATAGSAVLVAGVTVVIALVGLFVADIPFLTTTGIAAAVGVGVAVAVSLTALPALLAVAGERLRPRPRGRPDPGPGPRSHPGPADGPDPGPGAEPVHPRARAPFATWWVHRVTARPLLATSVVVVGLILCAVPAADLRLSLPDGGALDRGDPARVTYELLARHFGPGYNAPLLVMIDVLPSTDPVGVTNRIAREVAAVPGVASVPVATPNRTGDTAIVQVLPTTAADDPATARLVERLRALRPGIRQRYGLGMTVTGLTAVTIDLSDRLGRALLPFGLFVVGLSVVLLATVFRSVAVPLSAALGYLLSVGAAFGATSMVWTHGLLAEPLGVQHVGSVMAFLPILLMGVLFGLAMDYQMFLVSRMREHYVRHGDARAAVVEGFAASAKVVAAAAAIMFAVFSSFVPQGTPDTKPLAFSLAVGVLLDAFVVRMTLVPAVLALLQDRAWWLPGWADRRLPFVDAEGEGLTRELRLLSEPDRVGLHDGRGLTGVEDPLVVARSLSVRDDTGRAVVDSVTGAVLPGETVVVVGAAATTLLLAVGGRLTHVEGDLVVCGHVLPHRRRAVRRDAALIPRGAPDPLGAALAALDQGARLLLLDHADALPQAHRDALGSRLRDRAAGSGAGPAVLLGCVSSDAARDWLARIPGARPLDLSSTTRPFQEVPR